VQRSDASVVQSASEVTDGELLTLRFADDQLPVTAQRSARPSAS
jgi:hypothetical protein